MAKRKRKKAVQTWAARTGSEYVSVYNGKPKQNGLCGECGQKVYWNGDDIMADICYDGWVKATGVEIPENGAVQLKVTRVEE